MPPTTGPAARSSTTVPRFVRRMAFGRPTRSDEDHLAAWLSEEVCSVELSEGRLREALLARCRAEHIEPPGRLERILAAAGAAFDKRFCAQVVARLSAESQGRLEALIGDGADGALAELKADPGHLGLETLMNEIAMLEPRPCARPAGRPVRRDTPRSCIGSWRARAARCYPSDLRASASPVRLHAVGRPVLGADCARSPTRSSTCSSDWCTRSTPGPSAASKAS